MCFVRFAVFLIFITVVGAVMAQTTSTSAGTGSTLQDSLQKKAVELQSIQSQKNLVQKNLDTVLQSKNTLSREIKVLDSNISELNLSIKANQLNIETLAIEISTLNDEIAKTESSIVAERATVEKLLIALQERDHENTLMLILRSTNLSDAVAELQTITALGNSLTEHIQQLRSLQDAKNAQLDKIKTKKDKREQERSELVSQQYIVKDQKDEKQKLLSRTKNQEQAYQTQISALERVQAEISDEIEKIESVLRKNINPNLLPMPRRGLFFWPVPGGRLTQGYGSTAFALRNYKGKRHNGVDIGGTPIGSAIFAVESGVVINVGDQDRFCPKGAYGRFVVIKHDDGLVTLYGHMSRHSVSIGTKVEKGQLIGYIGRTGYATGPHLHFTVFASQTLTPARPGMPEGAQGSSQCGQMPVGGDLDPMLYL